MSGPPLLVSSPPFFRSFDAFFSVGQVICLSPREQLLAVLSIIVRAVEHENTYITKRGEYHNFLFDNPLDDLPPRVLKDQSTKGQSIATRLAARALEGLKVAEL